MAETVWRMGVVGWLESDVAFEYEDTFVFSRGLTGT